jgi:uncharacterized membrane protein YsdA (DUF1294 family)
MYILEQNVNYVISIYLVVMNLVGFTVMGIDKRRAITKKWRISENTLIIIAFIGGGIGAWFGMYVYRHKTKHVKFVIILPLTVIIYLALLLKIFCFI